MKKTITSLLLAAVLLGVMLVPTAQGAETVRVTLPDYPVTLNGQTVSNDYSRYPFLIYRDITYFPMTYYDCRLLGLEKNWSKDEGLSIEKTETGISEYIREVQETKNARVQQAKIAEGPITINGKAIDNSREAYPILSFRDVTYFPLTWRFAEEFGWEYAFDAETGLTASNPETAFASEEEGSWMVDGWGSLMGSGSMKLLCRFDAYYQDGRANPAVQLYNVTGKDITLLDGQFQWEYRIYRTVGKNDELVYRKAVPFYSGDLPAQHFAAMTLEDNYWSEDTVPGEYKCVLVHPEEYSYRVSGEEQVRIAPVEGDGYAAVFSASFTTNTGK